MEYLPHIVYPLIACIIALLIKQIKEDDTGGILLSLVSLGFAIHGLIQYYML